MRISDWSSDVCSSDLACFALGRAAADGESWRSAMTGAGRFSGIATGRGCGIRFNESRKADMSSSAAAPSRSEEHTSELQSLMRISYAVFCLKKKNNTITSQTHAEIN